MSAINTTIQDPRIEMAKSNLQKKTEEISKSKPVIVKGSSVPMTLIWQRFLLRKDDNLKRVLNQTEVTLTEVQDSFSEFKKWWDTESSEKIGNVTYFQARDINKKSHLTLFKNADFPQTTKVPENHHHLFFLYFEVFLAYHEANYLDEISRKIIKSFDEVTTRVFQLPPQIRDALNSNMQAEIKDATPAGTGTNDPVLHLISNYNSVREAIEKHDSRSLVTSLTTQEKDINTIEDDPVNISDIDFQLNLHRQEDVDPTLRDFSKHLGSCGLDAMTVFESTISEAQRESKEFKYKAAVYDAFIEKAKDLETHVCNMVVKKRRVSNDELQLILETSSSQER